METRSAIARRQQAEKLLEREQKEQLGEQCTSANSVSELHNLRNKPLESVSGRVINPTSGQSSIKSEAIVHSEAIQERPASSRGSKASSKKGSLKSSASKEAKKKLLLLEAAKQKAKIEMDIIDKTLEAQLAALSDEDEDLEEYSSQVGLNDLPRRDVQQWVEHQSYHIVPQEEQRAPDGFPAGELHLASSALTPAAGPEAGAAAHGPVPAPAAPPPPDATVTTLNNAVTVLAGALKELTTANVNTVPNASLLSRISTPKDLPDFAGDHLEWLQFKQAYYESTEVCKFTDRENLWRLRKCLRGPAKEAVAALFISASSPAKVMSTLELRFGNPDCIIARILQDLKKLQPLHHDYHRDIVTFAVKVQSFVEAVRAVGSEEYLQGMNIVSIILSKLPTVLLSKWSDYSYNLIKDGTNSPRLLILSDFLHDEAVKISTTASMLTVTKNDFQKSAQNKYGESSGSRSQTVLVHAEGNDNKCLFCRAASHQLTNCKHFKRALRKVRWQFVKRNGLCYKCLVSKHEREICQAPVCDKDGCGEMHHRLLHFTVKSKTERTNLISEPPPTACFQSSSDAASTSAPRECKQSTETLTHINTNACDRKVLLKVVPIRVSGPNGTVDSTALLDDGSSVSLISAGLARRVGLRGRPETLRVRGAFDGNEMVCESSIVNVDLTAIDNKVYSIKMRCVSELNLPLQSLSVLNTVSYSYLMDIKDNLCKSDAKPELLIGQDNHHLLMPLKIKFGNSNEPSATLTPLGWCVHGRVYVPQAQSGCRHRLPPLPAAHTNLCISEDVSEDHTPSDERMWRDVYEEVRRSFAIDSLGVAAPPRQHAEHERAVEQLARSATLTAGRWHVGLPWRDETCTLPDAYPSVFKRFRGIEIKMSKNLGFAERYQERIAHLLENDFARELTETGTTSKTFYLPHFGVDNPNKKKLRLVFDAANKVSGRCLNDYLLTGPDLLSSLLGIMLRFREHKVAVMGDIKDMFLRIKIRADDQDALRFLWRDNPTDDIKTYVMTSLIFGANCSPFVAQFIKNLNAKRFESSMPAAMDAICNSHYMDDYIDSLPDEATAIQMVKNITEIHRAGGFEIRNWASNSVAVLDSVPKETLGTAAVRFKFEQQNECERTLGLIWFPADDMLGFDLSLKRIPESIVNGQSRPTRRLMLRVIMSIFDVLGFLAPFTIQGRIMLQDAWRVNIGWDEHVPNDIFDKWQKWMELLKVINKIRIPRCYSSAASEYEGDRKQNTATRPSEMQGEPVAVAGTSPAPSIPPPLAPIVPTQLATGGYGVAPPSCATKVSDYNDLQLHMFCDASAQAMAAVGYWRWENNGYIYIAFIASKTRVMPLKQLTVPKAELQAAMLAARLAHTIEREHKLRPVRKYFWSDSTTVLHWIRNNTRTYKAFEANRLGEIDQLTRVDEWRYVPTTLNVADLATRESFNQSLEDEWFTGPTFLYGHETLWPKDIVAQELESSSLECLALTQDEPLSLPVPDPQRFSSWLRLKRATAAVLKFISLCKGQAGSIDCITMEKAERLLLRHAQAESFSDEIRCLSKGMALQRSSRLASLSPILDEHGILRASGRITAVTGVAPGLKMPFILDGRHPVTRLIVRQCHVRMAHDYQETVVNELKQTYWIIRLRPTVKFVASRCMLCRIRKCKPQVPRMGDLPTARMAHHQRPFSHCGLDLFGPMEVTVGRRREKRYGALFTCLTVRAVHIELVASLTTDSLIMALRRMAARRGWPARLHSDNGTNLRGADTELQRSMRTLDVDVLKTVGLNNGMEWSFIPPLSPHWGGGWERIIRSVKTSLRVILTERAPRNEVLSTLIAEVENIMNSRPLMHVSVEPDGVESLTPNHFLLGSSSNLPIIGEFDNSDLSLRKHWRTAQRLADMYWQRWVREILPDLIPRKKWQEERKSLKVGDLVLVVDPNGPRNLWPKGVVTQVFPGRDGRVRMVELKTATGVWRRSAARVAPISLSEECCDQH